jgi:enterochelin esterase family protein
MDARDALAGSGVKETLMRIVISFVMLSSLVSAQQAHVNLDFDPHVNHQNFKPYGASVISPEVLADKRVTFRVRAPKAQEVLLAAGPLLLALGPAGEKPIPFVKGEGGVWTLTVGPVAPNIYVYKVTIDGATAPDPDNTIAGHGDQPPYSMLVVQGSGPAYYDARPVPHGTVTRHIYHSDVTKGERELFVYAPPGYSAKQKYPVLYLLGGSGELAGNWAREGRANFILDNLLAEGKAKPMLIVMPNNQMVHRGDPEFRARGADLLEQDLRRHIIPLIETCYSVVADRAGRALAGLSMGGGHTQTAGFRSLDIFASFGVLSAGNAETEVHSAAFLTDPEVNRKVNYLLVGQGTWEPKGQGPTGARTAALRAALEKHNVKHVYYEGGGGAHDWGTWRHLLAEKLLPELWRK